MQTMNSTPDFQALKASLANSTFNSYTTPAKQKRQTPRESKTSCPSGKIAYSSIAEIMKEKNTFGSPVRYKNFYRCSVCGQYHFSRKEEEPARLVRFDRKKGNESLRQLVATCSSDRAEMEYASIF